MTIIDQVNASSRALVQKLVDKEPVNYIEAGLLYGITTTGRYHVAVLSVCYNHAQDPQLKELIKDALDNLTEKTVDKCESLLRAGDARVPTVEFPNHPLEKRLDIPGAAHFSDMEIAMMLVNMHGASTMALLAAINQSYQLEMAIELREQLNIALDWGYRLLQLTLHRGWLPELAKVEH
ncbi:MAG: DUF3231 family protein [Negativicutes bacterium]|nr:DUF3231 family protein [Negativicutes bacterium]